MLMPIAEVVVPERFGKELDYLILGLSLYLADGTDITPLTT